MTHSSRQPPPALVGGGAVRFARADEGPLPHPPPLPGPPFGQLTRPTLQSHSHELNSSTPIVSALNMAKLLTSPWR
jgi:hypothetical protein